MNDTQKIYIRSCEVVFSACDANASSLTVVPIFVTRVAQGKLILKDLVHANKQVLFQMTGLAKDKQVTRDLVTVEIELGYDSIRSWGAEGNSNLLIDLAHYTPTDLSNLGGKELIMVGENLIEKIGEIDITNLADHGYLPADLTTLQDTLTKFSAEMNKPEEHIKTNDADIIFRDKKYHELVDFMKNKLDLAAKPFKKKNPYFFTLYRKCRKLHLQGHRKSSGGEGTGTPGEFDIKVPMLKILAIPFKLEEGKIYLFSNLGNGDLVYWTQATPDVPATVPAEKWKIVGGDEATQNSVELCYPDKVFLFVANESNTEDGEIAIDEVI
ncbi:MAG: hypothetical protein WCL06_03295 [Bacteroidota bacterium]